MIGYCGFLIMLTLLSHRHNQYISRCCSLRLSSHAWKTISCHRMRSFSTHAIAIRYSQLCDHHHTSRLSYVQVFFHVSMRNHFMLLARSYLLVPTFFLVLHLLAINSTISDFSRLVLTRAAESKSKLELESVGVDRFGRSRSRSWSR